MVDCKFKLSKWTDQGLIVRAYELSGPLSAAIAGDVVLCEQDDMVNSKGDISRDFSQSGYRDSFISRFLLEATAVWNESKLRPNKLEIEEVFASNKPVLLAIKTGSFPALDKKQQENVVFERNRLSLLPLKKNL